MTADFDDERRSCSVESALVGRVNGGVHREGGDALRAAVKRTGDIVGAALGLIVLSPLLLVIAVLIVVDSPGPVFYRADRVGFRGRRLRMLKFRKMHADARGGALTLVRDERLTRLGGWLARTKMDELPQLWHVLRGEMSLVGPRPESPTFVARFPRDYAVILGVRPGLTGYTQIAFAREGSILDPGDPEAHYVASVLPQKVRLDRLYASRLSLHRDLAILIATLATLVGHPVAVDRTTGALTLRRRAVACREHPRPERDAPVEPVIDRGEPSEDARVSGLFSDRPLPGSGRPAGVDRGRRALAGILVAASVGCTATPAIATAGASCSTIATGSASDAAGTAAVAGQPTACEADAKEQDAAGPTGDPSDPPVAAVPAAAVVPVPAAGSAPPSAPLFEESGQAVGDDPAVSKDPGSEGPPRLGADRAAGEELPGGIPRAGDDGRHSSADAASADGAPLGVNDRAGAKTRAKENPPADGSDRAGGGRTASGGPGKGNDRAGGKSRTTNGASAGDGRPWGTPAVIGDGQALGEPTDSDAGAGTAAPRNSASVAIAARSIAHVTGDPIAPAADDPSAPVNADSGSGVPEPSSHIVGIAAATPRNAGAAGAPDARRTSAAPMHGPASGVVTTVQAAAGQIAAQTALRLSPRDVSAALLEPAPRSAVPTAHSSAPRAISPWLGAAPASEALNMAPSAPPRTAAPHGAGRHPTRSGAAGDGRDRRAPASPTAPRGRGSVTGSSGGTAGSAGSAVWCVILIGFLVYSIQPLRRHRVLLVAVGPVVFPALHERPG